MDDYEPGLPPASEILMMQARDRLTNRNNQMKRALEVIGRDGCDRYTAISGETCRTDGSTRTIDAEYSADQWCSGCIAAWGLETP